MKITRFTIKKLHGYKSYDLKFKDNTLILVGENGTGKTTVLRILFYLITGQWSSLLQYKFDSISLTINKKRITLKRSDIDEPYKHLEERFPPKFIRDFYEILDSGGGISSPDLRRLCDRYGVPFHMFLREIEMKEDLVDEGSDAGKEKRNKLKELLNGTQVIYLPTYRRIEQELSSIFKGLDEDDLRRRNVRDSSVKNRETNHIELVEFGMNDVQESIDKALEFLKDFTRESLYALTLGYLGDVVDQKYDQVDFDKIKEATEATIRNILGRIDILSEKSKKRLLRTIEIVKKNESLDDENVKVTCHYFIKLLDFQQYLEKKEINIRKFCKVCNAYMEDKVFEYTSSSFSFEILPKSDNKNKEKTVELNDLSSGEKQIVSLFSHLYLSNEKKIFVMIDEPELSLSLTWQRKFLVDIAKGDFFSGLLAVTHSPFIYDNELEKYTHGIGEFMTQEGSK